MYIVSSSLYHLLFKIYGKVDKKMVKRIVLQELPVEVLNDLQKSFMDLSNNIKIKLDSQNAFELYTEMNRALEELELQIRHINSALEERVA